uniref:Alpha-1,2-fucosyltransferase n=1 Tax=Panagrolaimus davidi TaxID=227884 RepID=A0A914Q9V7_9BILA
MKSHKLCVHIRRGDFLGHQQMESRAEFIEPSLLFLNTYIKQNISLIFIGDDMEFVKTLQFNQSSFSSIHYSNLKNRAEDMYFGIQICDTLLITASGSTFAWWIGYLLPESSQVFYNSQISKNRNYQKDYYDFDLFLPKWNMLELNNVSKTVSIDNRWFYERFSWPRNGIPPLF